MFDPAVGDVLNLWGETYAIQEHPRAPGMVFAAEAGRATVYKVKDRRSRAWALKVFFQAYRSPRVVESSQHLRSVEAYEGLIAAQRRVVMPDNGDARKYKELQYAVLMPWVPGKTWYDCLQSAEGEGRVHELHEARKLTSRFLSVMERLETSGIAHTDISAGNVTVEHSSVDTQLLDLEDMYLPNIRKPEVVGPGTPGYSHASREITWQASGDRYATAILSAELLLLSDDELAQQASSNGFFTDNRSNQMAIKRFRAAEPYLHDIAPAFTQLFVEAWHSDKLKSCPAIKQLRDAVQTDWGRSITATPRHGGVVDDDSSTDALPGTERVWWEKTDAINARTQEATSTSQEQLSGRVRFETEPDIPLSNEAAPRRSRKAVILAILAIAAVVLLLLIKYSMG